MKPSTSRVLGLLREAGDDGMSTGEFARAYCARFGARLKELTRDAAAIALRMTSAAAMASRDVSASMVRSVRGWSKAQCAIAESWGESMTALGREYVRQMRKA